MSGPRTYLQGGPIDGGGPFGAAGFGGRRRAAPRGVEWPPLLHPSPDLQEESLQGGLVGRRHGDQLEVGLGNLAGEQEITVNFRLDERSTPDPSQGVRLATLGVWYDRVLGTFAHHAGDRGVEINENKMIRESGQDGAEEWAKPEAVA